MTDLAQHGGRSALRHVRALPPTLAIGGVITLAWIVVALAAPAFTSYNPIAVDVAQALKPPSAEH